MSRPRDYQTEAIIIKKTKLGEADRILTLYTPNLGKIQAVAKGVRRPKSKMSGHLELFTHSLISLARGRNLDTITNVQTLNSFLPLKNDLLLGSYAYYVIELVEHFTADHIENYAIFHLVLNTLKRLSRSNNHLCLRYFDMNLLDNSGYRPQLQECVLCHKQLNPIPNRFSAGSGGLICPNCHQTGFFTYQLSVDGQKVLKLLQRGDYETASRLKISAGLSLELEQVMRYYIRYLLEYEVKSVNWIDTLRKHLSNT
ncbi:DNA repair protein RecO [Chloroflexota bacterium]